MFDSDLKLPVLTFSCIKGLIGEIDLEILSCVAETMGNDWFSENIPLYNKAQIYSFTQESHLTRIKYMLWTPVSSDIFTIFLTNMSDGWITLMNFYSKRYNREIFYITLSDYNLMFPIYRFYRIHGTKKRIVQLIKEEDGWSFFEEGEHLSFENMEIYKKRKIKDRLSNELIVEYLQKIGIDCVSKEFWRSEGFAKFYGKKPSRSTFV